MKKLIISAALVVAIAFSASSQKLNESQVPNTVRVAFGKLFPGITAKWEKENGKYEANFKQNNNKMSALFDEKGRMTESEITIKPSDLPASVLSYVKEHYKGKSIKEAAKITKADGTVNYETEVNGRDVIFDANGNFLKEEKD